MSARSDEELVRACCGELPYVATSFRVLMNRYKDRVYSKAVGMLGNEEDAKDVTQEVFVKLLDALPKFQFKSAFSTWLYSITVNTCLHQIDKRKRSPQWWLTEDIDEMQASEAMEAELFGVMSQRVDRPELAHRIEATLEGLPRQTRDVLELRFMDELDYQSIANQLELGLSATKMRLKRAREDFRRAYEEGEDGA